MSKRRQRAIWEAFRRTFGRYPERTTWTYRGFRESEWRKAKKAYLETRRSGASAV